MVDYILPDSSYEAFLFEEENADTTDLSTGITQMQQMTSEFREVLSASIESLLSEASNYSETIVTYDTEDYVDALNHEVTTPQYTDAESNIATPTFVGTIPESPNTNVTTATPPVLDIYVPAIAISNAPDNDIPSFNVARPEISTIETPDAPTYTLPQMPSLADLILPEEPTYEIPDFTAEAPLMDISNFDQTFDWSEAAYESRLQTQINGILSADIVNPNATGSRTVFYDRARARRTVESNRFISEQINFFTSRGYLPPPASMANLQIESSNRTNRIYNNLEDDIDICTAQLEQKHRKYTQTAAINWEKSLIEIYDDTMQRAFNAAKAATEVTVAVYESSIAGYKGQVEVYKARIQAYNSRIAAELNKAEFYKTQIEGRKVAVEAQQNLIDAYNAQIESIYTEVDIYRSQLEGAKIQAEIDRIQMESYAQVVRAFKAEIEANAARLKLYTAQIMGEEARIKMYESLVDAYDAQVEAYSERARVEIARSRIEIERLKGQAAIYESEVDRYAADVKYQVGQAETRVLVQRANNTNYQATNIIQEANLRYQGSIAIDQAEQSATQNTVRAQLVGAQNKTTAELAYITAQTSANESRANARMTAANISRHSITENISTSQSVTNSTNLTESEHWNQSSTVNHNTGNYFFTYHES